MHPILRIARARPVPSLALLHLHQLRPRRIASVTDHPLTAQSATPPPPPPPLAGSPASPSASVSVSVPMPASSLSTRQDNQTHQQQSQSSSMLPPSPFLTSVSHDPIILPPLLPATSKPNRGRNLGPLSILNLQEYLAVLYALIQAGNMDRAETIYASLVSRNPTEMRHVMDTNVYNVFIDGWMNKIDPAAQTTHSPARAGLEWFLRMKQASVDPDASSYAVLLRGLMQAQRADKSGALFRQVLSHPFLSSDLDPELVAPWNELLRANNVSVQINNTQVGGSAAVAMSDALAQDALRETRAIASSSPSSLSPDELADIDAARAELDAIKSELEQAKYQLYADKLKLPEPKAVGSLGLELLQENLRVIKEHGIGTTQFGKYALQLKLEEPQNEAHREGDRGVTMIRDGNLKRHMWQWHKALTEAVQEELNACAKVETNPAANKGAKKAERELYGPLLLQLSAEKLAMITIVEVLRMHVPVNTDEDEGTIGDIIKVNRVVTGVGAAVESEVNAEALRQRMRTRGEDDGSGMSALDMTIKSLDDRLFTNQRLFNMTIRRLYAKLQEEQVALAGDSINEGKQPDGLSSGQWLKKWPISSRAKVGSVLLSLLMDTAKISRETVDPATGATSTEDVPAFYHTYAFAKGKKLGIVKYHPAISEMLSREPVKATLTPKLLPMVVRPRAWLTYMSGGYLTSRSPCMRIKDNNPEQLAYLRAAAKHNRLNYILASLDVLGSTAWKVNEDVFKVVLEVWNSGEAPEEKAGPKYREFLKKKEEFGNFVRNAYSLRCDTNYKVEVARTFLGQEMYFPHNVDFRGRAYPMPIHLNHMSSDLCRGLMTFAEAKPLGERGWFWLKVHMASLHGYDKQSFSAREQWVMDNMPNILDSADNPLTGKRWWLKADDPWQCLATCYEISRAYRSGDPTAYASSLPIHQDGTCNGLQHYAALGGDLMGAQQVNLVAGDRPADVYTAVAEQVAKLVDKDAEKGHHCKQTVMTNVYGVTFVGARQQIQNRLKETKEYTEDDMYNLSAYLAKKVFLSIGKIFHGAQRIQDWLNEVARLIARSIPSKYAEKSPANMTSVVWTTPLGLTCVQPYRKEVRTQVKTLLQTVQLADPNNPAPVNTMKQRSAFPPNFIHSLDASHMMMTAVACHRAGLAFASVHDSYWTHACDVDTMNRIIRDEFVNLHSQPIMDNVVAEFEKRYKDYIVPVDASKSKKSDMLKDGGAEEDDESTPAAAGALKAKDVGMATKDEMADSVPSGSWVPLKLPPLPPRGDFDVRQVKSSNYFFH
ncbi:hypothetical protein BCR44DRAFT_1445869 [Catenaria anguillulae PL171]|uniref:DNA-directed RNA polymerase, mitochondrial n=1 Tax=Catenaria anguillulae PL171 TaxID=765915 RepID=A0A1Y2H6N5_9FUNG|nr:hypothetical protein BCR44DRAFT_1445869 [Catenaria anguillulae PL171]